MEERQNFKEFIATLDDLDETLKVAIINRHVEESREIIQRLNTMLEKEKGENELIRHAVRGEKEQVERYKERIRKCVDECRGALLAASAMLRYQHGTHRMKAHQNEAVASYLDHAAEGVKTSMLIEEELPF